MRWVAARSSSREDRVTGAPPVGHVRKIDHLLRHSRAPAPYHRHSPARPPVSANVTSRIHLNQLVIAIRGESWFDAPEPTDDFGRFHPFFASIQSLFPSPESKRSFGAALLPRRGRPWAVVGGDLSGDPLEAARVATESPPAAERTWSR